MYQKLWSSVMGRTLGKGEQQYSAGKKLQSTGNFSVDKIWWCLSWLILWVNLPGSRGYPDRGLNIISVCVCEGVSGKDQHLKWWTMWVVLIQSTEDLNRTKRFLSKGFKIKSNTPLLGSQGPAWSHQSLLKALCLWVTPYPPATAF